MTRTERVKKLCADMGVTLVDSPMSEAASNPFPASQGEQRKLNIPIDQLDSDAGFTAAMHELGHFATWKQHPLTLETFMMREMFGPETDTLDNEAAATQWAIENAGEILSPNTWWEFHAALCSYLNGFRYSHDGSAKPPALFRKVFNETCAHMNGSTLTLEDEYAEMSDCNPLALRDSFQGAESNQTI